MLILIIAVALFFVLGWFMMRRKNTDKADMLFDQGLKFLHEDKPAEALGCFDGVLKMYPGSFDVWVAKGHALYKLAIYKEALEAYETALNINPESHITWNSKGCTLTQMRRYDLAESAFDTAIKLNPGYNIAIENRQSVRTASGDFSVKNPFRKFQNY